MSTHPVENGNSNASWPLQTWEMRSAVINDERSR